MASETLHYPRFLLIVQTSVPHFSLQPPFPTWPPNVGVPWSRLGVFVSPYLVYILPSCTEHPHDFHHQFHGLATQSSVLDSDVSAWLSHNPLLSPGLIRYLSSIHLAPQGRTSERPEEFSLYSHPHPPHDQGLLTLPLNSYQIWPLLSIPAIAAMIQAASSLTWMTAMAS